MFLITHKEEKHKFETAARTLASSEFSFIPEYGRGHIREEFNSTHIMVSPLKAWKVTVIGIERNRASF